MVYNWTFDWSNTAMKGYIISQPNNNRHVCKLRSQALFSMKADIGVFNNLFDACEEAKLWPRCIVREVEIKTLGIYDALSMAGIKQENKESEV